MSEVFLVHAFFSDVLTERPKKGGGLKGHRGVSK